MISNIDVSGDNSVDGLVEVHVLVVVAVDRVVDVWDSNKDGECNSEKHKGNKVIMKTVNLQ